VREGGEEGSGAERRGAQALLRPTSPPRAPPPPPPIEASPSAGRSAGAAVGGAPAPSGGISAWAASWERAVKLASTRQDAQAQPPRTGVEQEAAASGHAAPPQHAKRGLGADAVGDGGGKARVTGDARGQSDALGRAEGNGAAVGGLRLREAAARAAKNAAGLPPSLYLFSHARSSLFTNGRPYTRTHTYMYTHTHTHTHTHPHTSVGSSRKPPAALARAGGRSAESRQGSGTAAERCEGVGASRSGGQGHNPRRGRPPGPQCAPVWWRGGRLGQGGRWRESRRQGNARGGRTSNAASRSACCCCCSSHSKSIFCSWWWAVRRCGGSCGYWAREEGRTGEGEAGRSGGSRRVPWRAWRGAPPGRGTPASRRRRRCVALHALVAAASETICADAHMEGRERRGMRGRGRRCDRGVVVLPRAGGPAVQIADNLFLDTSTGDEFHVDELKNARCGSC